MSKERRKMSEENGSISPQCFHKDIPYADIQLGDVVGRGAYGTVHKAMWNGIQVAVKVMEGDDAAKTLNKEVHQLSKLRHENIIRLYGVSSQKPKVCLIMEYAENGSLYDLLHPKEEIIKPYEYTIGHMMSWALQCARAMEYLHGLTPTPIVHRDLKPPNMLLKEHGTVLKICDFGTARLQDTSHMTVNKGSAAWMAPEVFAGPSYTEKCDIFSFGILLWEMITRQKPFEDIGSSNFRILWAVHSGTRPPLVRGIPKIFEQLMVFAWDKDPNVRPPFSAIVLFLEKASKFVSGGNTPLVLPVATRTDSNSESCSDSYSDSSSYFDTTKEQHSSMGSSGQVSITGKDKVMYKVSSPEQSPLLSEYDKLPIKSLSSGDQTFGSPHTPRKSQFSPVHTPEKEGLYAGHTESPKQGLVTPEAPDFNYPPYSIRYSDIDSINDPATRSSNIDGSNTNPNMFQKQNYRDEGMSPPAYPYSDYHVRPRQLPHFDESPIHATNPGVRSPQFPVRPPYFPPRPSPVHGLRTPSPGNAPHLYDPQPWNIRAFHPVIPEHPLVGGVCGRFSEMNVNDFGGNDNVFIPNATAPGHPSGRSSLDVSRSGSSRSSGTSSPLNSAFSSPSASEKSLENRLPRIPTPRHPAAIPQSAPENRYEENLWHLIDPEIMPLTPIQSNQESLEIYEDHSKLIYDYVNLQKEFEYLLQRKREITKQLEDEKREQQRSSIYLEEYLNLLEERQSLSAFLGTLRHDLQQANTLRGGPGENLL